MTTTDFLVEGMHCSHCVASVTDELSRIEGVSGVEIDLSPDSTSRVQVRSDVTLDEARVRTAIEDAGYRLAPGA